MIVLDIETSGMDKVRCGVWQIGALEFENPKNYFLQEAKIDDEDKIINSGKKPVLEIIGKTEEELRDKKKQPQKQLLENFFKWIEERRVSMKNFLCQNPQFDVGFLEMKSDKYGLKIPFHYRVFDLHSIAQKSYHDLYGEFLIKDEHSDMGLTSILRFVGMEDNRKVHNALEDCKLTGECFSRLIYGKNLFPEYAKYDIPKEIKK
ncbi:MAG: 3'-5' exonuclease [Nanoarchaeota archaeon]|nr:3'-5' exonuclease [Nanoarchaeota archaeon]